MVNLTEVVGDVDRYGQNVSISAALPLIDMVAGRCAYERAAGPVVTGSFDSVELLTNLRHGDVLSAEAQVLAVGKSSMLLQVDVSRNTLHQRQPRTELTITCHTTFVAVDERTRRPRSIPPAPDHTGQSDQPAKQHTQAHALQSKYKGSRRLLSVDDVPTLRSLAETHAAFTALYNDTADSELQNIDHSVIRIRKQFLPRHLNFSGIVFGGDILQTLERTAVACANRIQGGKVRLQTVSVRGLMFLRPVPAINVLQVEAKAIATSQRVMCIIVRSYLDEGSELVLCHQGVFHLIPVGREGNDDKLSVGVRSIWNRDDEHIRDFYRTMTLPLTKRIKLVWGLKDDDFPSEREPWMMHAGQ